MESPEEPSKLSTVLNRFRSTFDRIQNDESRTINNVEATDNVVKAEGLTALPQPEISSLESETFKSLEWPVTPQFVDPKRRVNFEELGVSEELCKVLKSHGFDTAFAVQCAVIPEVLNNHKSLKPDSPAPILVNSFTGSGKTLAYTVPIVDLLKSRRIPRLRALILLPTKVLIQQVHQVLEQLSGPFGLKIISLKPERSLSKESALLKEGFDIVVSAPGRLVEHISNTPNLLEDLQFLVVDEADRLVGQNFQNWQQAVAFGEPRPPKHDQAWKRLPQKLIFSATLTRDPSKLASLEVTPFPSPNIPSLYVIGEQKLDGRDEFSLPKQLQEHIIKVGSLNDKPLALVNEIINNCSGRCIVFVRSNESASRLARLIELVGHYVFGQQIKALRCSGEMRVQDRKRVLKEFNENDSGILVCTDLIARGIDMHIDFVINYDFPFGAREYVHRVGRTARAGNEGTAITLLVGSDLKHFNAYQYLIARSNQLEEREADLMADEKYEEALAELGKEVNNK